MQVRSYVKEIINEIYDECNVINNVSDSQIFEKIQELHPRLGVKNKRIVYAHVCSKLFGDDVEDVLEAFK